MRYDNTKMDFVEQGAEMENEGVLQEAIRITSSDRAQAYGPPEDNFSRIALLQAAWLLIKYGKPETIATVAAAVGGSISGEKIAISRHDVAIMSIMTKLAREAASSKRDNLVDIAGYARCAARIAGHE